MLPDILNSTAWFEGSQAPLFSPPNTNSIKVKMIMEHWWHDTDRRKLKYLSLSHYLHHKSHVQ